MNSRRSYAGQELRSDQLRLGRSAASALRVLETCPLLPVDAFRGLTGLRSIGGAYKQLARLRSAGLADAHLVDVGYLLSQRPLGLWKITELGRQAIEGAAGARSDGSRHVLSLLQSDVRRRDKRLTVLVATYRLLSDVVAERARTGNPVEVVHLEYPWTRSFWSAERDRVVHLRLPGYARLVPLPISGRSSKPGMATNLLLLPDLGTAPVARHREALRRLVALANLPGGCMDDLEWELAIATADPDGHETRRFAWLRLLERAGLRYQTSALTVHMRDLAGFTGLPQLPAGAPDDTQIQGTLGGRAPVGGHYQVLHLIGRHPFLTVEQLSDLLGTRTARIRQLERDLVERGWLRRIRVEEVPDRASVVVTSDWDSLGLVEITQSGRLQLAAALGLDATTATRYHGFTGYGRGQTGRRLRLLRTLAHTLGANAIFSALCRGRRGSTSGGGQRSSG